MGKISKNKRRSVISQRRKKREKLGKLKERYSSAKNQTEKKRIKEKAQRMLSGVSVDDYFSK